MHQNTNAKAIEVNKQSFFQGFYRLDGLFSCHELSSPNQCSVLEFEVEHFDIFYFSYF